MVLMLYTFTFYRDKLGYPEGVHLNFYSFICFLLSKTLSPTQKKNIIQERTLHRHYKRIFAISLHEKRMICFKLLTGSAWKKLQAVASWMCHLRFKHRHMSAHSPTMGNGVFVLITGATFLPHANEHTLSAEQDFLLLHYADKW